MEDTQRNAKRAINQERLAEVKSTLAESLGDSLGFVEDAAAVVPETAADPAVGEGTVALPLTWDAVYKHAVKRLFMDTSIKRIHRNSKESIRKSWDSHVGTISRKVKVSSF